MSGDSATSIVEASINQILSALDSGRLTAVDLVAKCLLRIAKYDTRTTALNSIPLLNPNCFDEAAESDDRRRRGETCGRLEGVPFTVKDSYKVKAMTVASGSDAFCELIATDDAFAVDALRSAGAVLIGKTNMCPMAFGGMLRGVYGRAESPYNSNYLAAAFASGSSNGSGVSTASSLCAFGMGEETVSSGRSPASNNAIVAYTPSRGLISIRGNWPLYPTCDVVVPHTRSMEDLFQVLDVLAVDDNNTVGDFWRDQPFVNLKSWVNRPKAFSLLKNTNFLKGKRIAAPAMYLGGPNNESTVYTSDAVRSLWLQAKSDLEACGAEIEICDFPVVTEYENASSKWLPEDWNSTERGTLIAHAWDNFLQTNGDPNMPRLASANASKLFPQLPPDDPQVRFSEVANAVQWSKLAGYVENNNAGDQNIYRISNLERATEALEQMRKILLEDWMAQNKYDLVVFPAAGDVGYAEADVDVDLAEHTWKNGVKYSNGNRALRHLGIPSVTIPMGLIPDRSMPMGLTFLGKAYDDAAILQAGYSYEQKTLRRTAPPLTPTLVSDNIGHELVDMTSLRPKLEVTECEATWVAGNAIEVSIAGKAAFAGSSIGSSVNPILEVYLDGERVKSPDLSIANGKTSSKYSNNLHFGGKWFISVPPQQNERNRVQGKIARDSTAVIMLARDGERGRPSGCLRLIHADDVSD